MAPPAGDSEKSSHEEFEPLIAESLKISEEAEIERMGEFIVINYVRS